MNKSYLFLFLIGLCLSGCNKAPKQVIIIDVDEAISRFDTISIEINSDLMGKYERWSISQDKMFVAYHHLLHKIDVFDLSKNEFSHSINLEREGPNGILFVNDVLKIGNEFLIDGNNFFYRINQGGLITSKKDLRELQIDGYTFQSKSPGPQIGNFNEISIDYEKQCVYKPIYKYLDNGVLDFKSPFMCSIDIADWKVVVFEIEYPQLFIENYPNIGFLGSSYLHANEDLFICQFPGLNTIFTYKKGNKTSMAYEPEIFNKNSMNIKLDDYGTDPFWAEVKGRKLSPRYLNIKYDHRYNSYFRMHKTRAKSDDMFDADYFLVKMNNNFETVAQYNLGNIFSPLFHVLDGEVYFAPQDINQDALHFLKLYRIKS